MKKNNISFEDALNKLELLSEHVENGNLTLDELVEAFKNGSELYDICNNKLHNAKLEIQKVQKVKKT